MNTMHCHEALLLVPGYLDGELSEAQAAPLRRHLLDCPGCREAAKGEKHLKAWFSEPLPLVVPAGFAARVAQLAFAPVTAREPVRILPRPVPRPELAGRASLAGVAVPAREVAPGDSIQGFVLALTALAAAVLLLFALGIQSLRHPNSFDLRAEDDVPRQRAEILEELERLNTEAAEAALLVEDK